MAKLSENTSYRINNFKETMKLLKQSFSESEENHGECVSCRIFSRNRMAGAACRQRKCSMCPEIIYSGSTDVNMVCDNCARDNGLCRRCGSNKNDVKSCLEDFQ